MNGQYLLFDFVHLLKNIRNLWLREKRMSLCTTIIVFEELPNGNTLRTWHKLESDKLLA